MSLNIVVLDAVYANPGDLSWDPLKSLGEVTLHQRTPPNEVLDRSKSAEVLVINKVKLGAKEFDQLPNLKMVAISATGTDNVDLKAAEERNIVVKNAEGYSTDSVAQHTLALLLELTNRIKDHNDSVKRGEWNSEKGFSYFLSPVPELKGKKLGIYGFGKIGQKVAKIGEAFGMKIYVVSRHAKEEDYPFYRIVDLPTLFSDCDVVSLHSPLTDSNKGIVDKKLISQMKSNAILLSTARGALINEDDLAAALKNKKIAGAGLDVLVNEPPQPGNPLLGLENCIITPHMAWTSTESRKELIDIVAENIRSSMNSLKDQPPGKTGAQITK